MSRSIAFAPVATVLAFSIGCSGAPSDNGQDNVDQSSTDEALTSSALRLWVRNAEYAWTSRPTNLPAPISISPSVLPPRAAAQFNPWNKTHADAFEWTYQGRTGYFVDGLYNGSDSIITKLFDASGRLLSTNDSPNGETIWVHPDHTQDDGSVKP
jgi:hypothetical protein